ncbi:MAG TPA: hypothetical protein ENK27_06025 [Desulfobulbus sp.]|nr:hypothetical protein [Desulfobulbus sp.]
MPNKPKKKNSPVKEYGLAKSLACGDGHHFRDLFPVAATTGKPGYHPGKAILLTRLAKKPLFHLSSMQHPGKGTGDHLNLSQQHENTTLIPRQGRKEKNSATGGPGCRRATVAANRTMP